MESSLSELCADVEKCPQVLVNVRVDEANEVMDLPALKEAVNDVESLNLMVKVVYLLRPSGTEPLIRVMVEGRDAQQVMRLADQLADVK